MLTSMVNTIEFPKLGIGPMEINRVAFSLFGLDIYWYAIIITAGMLTAILFAMKQAKKFGLTSDNVLDVALIGIPSAVIGGRLFFVLFTLDQYGSFLDAIDIRDGGMAIYGAVIAAFIAGFLYCKHKKIKTLALFDLGSLGFLIGQTIGRWGNFVNAEVYGRETDIVFGMTINGNGPYHPLFLYESVWNLCGFIMLFLFAKYLKKHNGEIFALYFFWYGLNRAFMESLRVEEYTLTFLGLKIDLWLAAIFSVLGLLFFFFIRFDLQKKLFGKRKKRTDYKDVYRPLVNEGNGEKSDSEIEENVVKYFNENKNEILTDDIQKKTNDIVDSDVENFSESSSDDLLITENNNDKESSNERDNN